MIILLTNSEYHSANINSKNDLIFVVHLGWRGQQSYQRIWTRNYPKRAWVQNEFGRIE